MVEGGTDTVHTTKSGKKTLLERYDIPVEQLSYEYISECTNAKKLERIVTILRSGEEGHYPDLTKHAEQRLATVKPTSIVLRKTEPILTRSMLDPDEYKQIDQDITDWMSEMQLREKDLEEGKNTLIEPPLQPDIRQTPAEPNNGVVNAKNTAKKTKRISSCDYSAWDKYDVDTELNKIDIRDEQRQIEAKRFQQKQKEKIAKKKLEKQTIINKSSLTGTELDVMAEQEREKGNEAFRAGDYEEALEHYNTSVKINPNITTFNNRAITYIKLRRYEDALNDCNLVLSAEYTNIKALLRRALALEHIEKPSQALVDYEAILMLEPNNTVAIAGVRKLRKPCESRKVRMAIEEQCDDTQGELKYNQDEKQKNCKPQINSKINSRNSICYCHKAPGPSQNLNPPPHIKADYCLETENAITSKNKGKNTPQLTKSFPFINKYASAAQNNSTTRQKSNFSYTNSVKRSSSVIIEELPSEPRHNNSINEKNKLKKPVASNNSLNIVIANECNSSGDAKVNISNVKNLNMNNTENYSPVEKNIKKPCITKAADKYENKNSKEEKYIQENFSNIESGYEFMRIWRSLKNDTDLKAHAQLLRAINVDKLASVLGNELDGNMLSTILHCLEQHFCTSNDTALLNNFLRSFCQMKRFSIVNMFMNAEDKQVINNILHFLEEQELSGVSTLRQIYSI